MSWRLLFTPQAQKDGVQIDRAGLRPQVERLLDLLRRDPLETPPPCEKLRRNLAGCYSRRINRQHRLVYEIHQEERAVRILRMWTHYGD